MTREAELETEIARLRKFILTLSKQTPEELSTPPSTTALQELIEKIERRTIEQCETSLGSVYYNNIGEKYGEVRYGISACIAAIRSLPTGNLKLEDLK